MKKEKINREFDQVYQSVKPDYYEQGIKRNIFQWYWHTKRYRAIKEMLNGCRGRALDIGCHSGDITKLIAEATGGETHGLDISSAAIEYARRKYPDLHFRVTLAQSKFPEADGYYDLVTCFDILEHFSSSEIEKIIQEIKRVLKGGGYLIIGVPIENILWKIIWFFWNRAGSQAWRGTHLYKLTRRSLESLFEKNGFTKIQEKNIHLGMWRIIKYKRS